MPGHWGLQKRHLDVLKLVAEGYTNQKVSELLALQPGTVTQYLHDVYQATGTTSGNGRRGRLISLYKRAQEGCEGEPGCPYPIHRAVGDKLMCSFHAHFANGGDWHSLKPDDDGI